MSDRVGVTTVSLTNGPEPRGRTYSSGEPWHSVQEGLLQAIVQRANLPKRSTTKDWSKVADQLSRAGETLGYPLRSPSACRNKARSMGLIAKEAPTPAATLSQASFASPEVKAEVGRSLVAILRRIADELEHSA